MTPKRRIALNIVATYGIPRAKLALCGVRSLYALALGLFCGRLALMGPGGGDCGWAGVTS